MTLLAGLTGGATMTKRTMVIAVLAMVIALVMSVQFMLMRLCAQGNIMPPYRSRVTWWDGCEVYFVPTVPKHPVWQDNGGWRPIVQLYRSLP